MDDTDGAQDRQTRSYDSTGVLAYHGTLTGLTNESHVGLIENTLLFANGKTIIM